MRNAIDANKEMAETPTAHTEQSAGPQKTVLTRTPTHHRLGTAHRRFHATNAVSRSKQLRSCITRYLPSTDTASKRFTSIRRSHSQKYSSNVQFGSRPQSIGVLPLAALSRAGTRTSSRLPPYRIFSARSQFVASCDVVTVSPETITTYSHNWR